MENGRDEEGDVQDDSKCCRAVIKEQWKKVAEEFSMEKEAAFIKVCGDEQQRFSVKFGGVYCEFNSRFISEPYVLGFVVVEDEQFTGRLGSLHELIERALSVDSL
uniref:Uncharacterized protein n=1 Tax=Cucumis sativus TaxID=3659 RepID=A0A0A0M136_CUCSA